MEYKFFIQSNKRQYLGALLAKFAMERANKKKNIPVEILLVEDIPVFQEFGEKSYLRAGRLVTDNREDLQSFTLTRFMPPERMNYSGRAVVIDPDIFAIADVEELFSMDMKGKAILAVPKKKGWDTSVMLLDCARLTHWKIADMLRKLASHTVDYDDIIFLKHETSVGPLDPSWNHLDILNQETKMLHTTRRLTQPWRTGLPIDFTRNPMPKIFGIFPREPFHKLLGKYPTHYEPHPDKNIEAFFFALAKDALAAGAVTEAEVKTELAAGHLRKDFFSVLERV